MIIGIDPGLSGAIASLSFCGELVSIIDMPIKKIKDSKKNKKMLHANSLFDHLKQQCCEIVVEKVHSMPRQGVASTFTFGMSYGGILAIAECCSNYVTLVRPQEWKKHFNLIGEDKKAGILVVENLYPESSHLFFTQRGRLLDGRVDAVLIARYFYDTAN